MIEIALAANAMPYLLDASLAIDVLVTDFLMHKVNGAELAGKTERLRPGLPILLITGYSNLADGPAARLPRLLKPFRQADLAEQVARLLERSRQPVIAA